MYRAIPSTFVSGYLSHFPMEIPAKDILSGYVVKSVIIKIRYHLLCPSPMAKFPRGVATPTPMPTPRPKPPV